MVVSVNEIRRYIPPEGERKKNSIIYEKIEKYIDGLILSCRDRLIEKKEEIEYWVKASLEQEEIRYLKTHNVEANMMFLDLKGAYKVVKWNVEISVNEDYEYTNMINIGRRISINILNGVDKDTQIKDFPLSVEISMILDHLPVESYRPKEREIDA